MDLNIVSTDLSSGLYLIAMPIGNKHDISIRALKTLMSVDIIASEDTRVFKAFAKSIDLPYQKVISYNKDNESASAKELVRLIKEENKAIALVSDAGTINISDPGHKVIDLCLKQNIYITSLPGPSSLTTSLSLCPGTSAGFQFHGFAPKKSHTRQEQLQNMSKDISHIYLESSHRIHEHLKDAATIDSTRKIFVAKDLSKEFETLYYDTSGNLHEFFHKNKIKGEFVVIYLPQTESKSTYNSPDIHTFIKAALSEQLRSKQIIKLVKTFSPLSREEIYTLIEATKDSQHE